MTILLLLRRIRSLCVKELLVILKDPSSRVVLIVPILIQSLLFGYAATYDLNYVPYVVCDQSRSSLSRDLIAHVDAAGMFSRQATLAKSSEAESWIYDGKALLALQIGPDFAERLHSGDKAAVQVILDGRNSTTASIAMGYVGQMIASWNEKHGLRSPVSVVPRARYNPQLETRWNIMPAMIACLSFVQVLVLGALSVAREREQGTFDQMLVTPLSPWEILVGKAIPPVIVGLVQSTLVLLICIFWFKIPFAGRIPTLYASLLIFTLSCSGIGLCISAIAKSMQQAMVFCFVVIMPLMLLSGMATPVSSMPDSFQAATCVNPVRFAILCVRRIYLEGASLADIAASFIPMLAVAAVTLPLAGWLFRNRLS